MLASGHAGAWSRELRMLPFLAQLGHRVVFCEPDRQGAPFLTGSADGTYRCADAAVLKSLDLGPVFVWLSSPGQGGEVGLWPGARYVVDLSEAPPVLDPNWLELARRADVVVADADGRWPGAVIAPDGADWNGLASLPAPKHLDSLGVIPRGRGPADASLLRRLAKRFPGIHIRAPYVATEGKAQGVPRANLTTVPIAGTADWRIELANLDAILVERPPGRFPAGAAWDAIAAGRPVASYYEPGLADLGLPLLLVNRSKSAVGDLERAVSEGRRQKAWRPSASDRELKHAAARVAEALGAVEAKGGC